jgi:prephenate dehydrogenase
MSFRRFSILGLGLIGGSVALAMRKRISNCHITGYDINRQSLADASAAEVIDVGTVDLRTACEGNDAILLCLPIAQSIHILGELAPFLAPEACITDVCGTKRSIVDAAARLLPKGVHFVGAHPMAGRELSGFAAARADLFEGAECLLTPIAQTDSAALANVEAMWRSLGARTRQLPPEDHDRLVAQISHFPHLLASALMTAVTDQAMAISGPGFRDVTRIAASDGALWRDILLDNADEVRRCITHFRTQLDEVDAFLESGNADDLRTWLDAAAIRRKALGKSGG